MTRMPEEVNGEGKGKQKAQYRSDMMTVSPPASASSSPPAGRPATLSPDSARAAADTHPRTSRFLRRSRSKQQLRDNDDRTGAIHDEGLPASSASMDDTYTSLPSPTLPPRSPMITPASPIRPQVRPSTFTSPLSSGGGNSQNHSSYSPQKSMGSQSGRSVGGWFTSMLASSQNAQGSQSNNDDAASIRSYATTATSPSRFLQRKSARDSPNRRSTFTYNSNGSSVSQSGSAPAMLPTRPVIGKMGGLDRMLDRAVQFFTDSDSNADKCPDDIWLLGVRHQGWRPEQDQRLASPSRSPSGRPSIDTLNSESYFHVGETSNNLPRPSDTTRQMAMSGRRRLSKSSNKTMSSNDATSPASLELPLSPPRAKSSGLFKSRRGASADAAPASQFLERTTSGSSSSSSAARSEFSRYSSTPAVMEEPAGLPSPTDDRASVYTFNTETQSSKAPRQISSPASSNQTYGWPPAFYHDFYSRVQLTYRSGFSPLPSSTPGGPVNSVANAFSSMMTNLNASIGRSMSVGNLGDTQPANGLSSDAGWGCMLRTGQSLLANALMDVHLGRDFRRPLPHSLTDSSLSPSFFSSTPDYSRYVRLLSWFFDDPSPVSPFSIHKFATEGKKLGKQIGEWFGPSTAAGAIKVLANDYAPANLGVALAIDTTVYGSEVFHVARGDGVSGWNRPVLILVPLRLGLNGVNPIYFNSLQHYFTLPQCVGIAGGRPSSSYYFVGAQGNQLFYIDPHHTKPSVKAVNVPEHIQRKALAQPLTRPPDSSRSPATEAPGMDDVSLFFANAYGPKELESFHCDKVRKMSLSALDPSMLVGLLCQSKEDWEDLCRRMKDFPSSKDHHHIINIVNEMPAWMKKSTRTASGAGLNASTSSSRPAAQSRQVSGASPKPSESMRERPGDDIEGSSVDYADSDDWDIDDSDDEDTKSDESDKAEDLGDESIIIKPSSSPFQEVHPGSFESDEPDYKASRNGRSPIGRMQDLPIAPMVVGTPSSTGVSDDFERVNIDPTQGTSHSTNSWHQAAEPVLSSSSVLVPRSKQASPEKRTTSIEVEDKEAGWEAFNGRPKS